MLTNQPTLSHPRPTVKSSQIPQGWPWETVSVLHTPCFALCSWLFQARLDAAIPSTSFGKALNQGVFRCNRGVPAGFSAGAGRAASDRCSLVSPAPPSSSNTGPALAKSATGRPAQELHRGGCPEPRQDPPLSSSAHCKDKF